MSDTQEELKKVYKYEITIEYIDAHQVRTIKDMLDYDLWSPAEVEWKKRSSFVSWEVSGRKPLSKYLANKARNHFKESFAERGEQVENIVFKEIGEVL